ncbi:MAG TPA: adenylate/guanylate cyclase domain-containing protein [Stellaceae bacterium]|nr:adenylate/guanylate cyclase domain-containing protein [Stellaceae bacterium]
MSATRRLAAILAADVAGSSRLIGHDEQGTLDRLRTIRIELIDPSIATHNGRIFKTTGDGLLAEFGSTVDSLRAAQEIQAQMAERDAGIASESRIEFRIGIHQGDIVVEDGDIFGDGVNIAARLEGLAEPGGICVSARVQEDAAGKLDLAFRDLGDQQLKNIARPVRAYAIGAAAVAPAGLVAASVPRLSIVVLPFANLNSDAEQQYFADGLTEDLTTDLSRLGGTSVISRNTAFTYQGKRIDTRQIGRELGVRYVLEGSVRRSGDHIRISAQLIDAQTDAHLWAERFDGDVSDLFALQDEVTRRIAITLNLELAVVEAARPTDNPDALDYIFRGRAATAKPPSLHRYSEAIGLFERALTLDPRSVEAQSRLAILLAGRVLDNMTGSPAADIARAETLAEQVLAASPRSPLAHNAKGQVLRTQRRFEEAIREYETVLAVDRNRVNALHHLAQCKLLNGSIHATIPLLEQAIRLSPRDSMLGLFFLRDWASTPAAITHGRGHRLVRKGALRRS